MWNKLLNTTWNKIWGEQCLFSYKKLLKLHFPLTLLRKKINFFHHRTLIICELILSSACINSSKYWTALKNFCLFIFLNKLKLKSKFENFLWENEYRSSHILLLISVPNFIRHNLHFLWKKFTYFESYPRELTLLYPTSCGCDHFKFKC